MKEAKMEVREEAVLEMRKRASEAGKEFCTVGGWDDEELCVKSFEEEAKADPFYA